MKLALLPLALLAAGFTAVTTIHSAPTAVPATPITGDYVEARTASVFAGACHYNGELVTTGDDAVLAFSIADGTYNGTSLAGVRAVATLSSPKNLGYDHTSRKSELVVDPAASEGQVKALVSLLNTKFHGQLGDIAAVRRAPVSFERNAETGEYTVNAKGFASLDVQPLPNGECCKQPNLVWYEPILPVTGRKVGYTTAASVTPTIADPWSRSEENSAFYGHLNF
jgi:hypothetical protein